MGQKIHPLGFRLGITKKHQSQWFARFQKKKYSQTVLEDIFLRQTISKIIPLILNKKEKNISLNENITSKEIFQPTYLKIERGLMPYEIEIQIHSGNCELLKSAFKNSDFLSFFSKKKNDKIKKKLDGNFQKTFFYLNYLNVRLKLEKLSKKSNNKSLNFLKSDSNSGEIDDSENHNLSKKQINMDEKMLIQENLETDLSFKQKKSERENSTQRRFKKRQSIERKSRQRLLGVPGVINLSTAKEMGSVFDNETTKNNGPRTSLTSSGLNKKKILKRSYLNFSQLKNISGNSRNQKDFSGTSTNLGLTFKKKRKFFDIFLKKINKRFFIDLKQEMKNWKNFIEIHNSEQIQKYGALKYAPLGYQKKWSLSRLEKIKKQPLNKLKKLVNFLQMEAIKKMESLRKNYFLLGCFSKGDSFSYYQMLNFLKNLKLLITKQTNSIFLDKSSDHLNKTNTFSNLLEKESFSLLNQQGEENSKDVSISADNFYSNYTKKFIEKFHNIDEECRQQYFLDYLSNGVKNHRKKNLFLYLGTLADSRNDLKRIREFTKEHSNFLFGLDRQAIKKAKELSLNSKEQRLNLLYQLNNKVTKVLEQSKKKSELDKNLQDVFLEKLQKQKTMYQKNLEFEPKIVLKFYSVKSEKLKSNASLVADSIVDDLEKRKAFRRVIKQAKENLLDRKEVKGVKIQVSGRLNGAEIARTEWVRSGRVPLQTLRADLDYSFKQAQTLYGIIGVKVWIYKGEKLTIK